MIAPTIRRIAPIATGVALLASGVAHADETEVPESLKQLTINGQALKPESIQRVELEGPIYEVRLRNGDTFYSDAEGRYMVVGNLYDNSPAGLINVTERNDRQARLDQLEQLPDEGMVVYPAQTDEIGVITVFTDTTCPYCQMLHQEIEQLTLAGVTVRYVPYPRAGSHSSAARQLAQVLCSKSPQDSMTSAFAGQTQDTTPTQRCQAAVDEGYRLGQRFGVKGTPSIVLPSGEIGEGFLTAKQLIQAIKGTAS